MEDFVAAAGRERTVAVADDAREALPPDLALSERDLAAERVRSDALPPADNLFREVLATRPLAPFCQKPCGKADGNVLRNVQGHPPVPCPESSERLTDRPPPASAGKDAQV